MVNGTISWQNDNFARATLLANNNIEFANMNGISLELLFASYTNMVAQTPCVNPNIPICNLIQNVNFEFINPGFIVNTTAELYKACPWNNAATSWNNGTSDLYRSNATGCFVQVPQQKIIACTTLISEQDDINLLDAYAGIVVWDQPNNWREYLQQHLLSPLVANKKYYVEFWSSLHDASENAIDQIDMHLSTTPDVQFGSFPIILTPQINSPAGVVMDNRMIWNRISGCYTALGNEEYITIGNFTANANTAVSNVTTLGSYSLGPLADYFIDEVTIVPFEVEAGPDKGACGVPVQIGIPNCLTPYASAPYNSITYSWAPATGLSSTSIFNPIASPITTTSYTVTATTSTGCTTTDVVVVNVGTSPPPIQLTQSATDIFCPNTAVNVSVNTNFGWTYLWSGGQNSNSIIVNNAGTYTVTVTNTYVCSSTLSTTINSYPCCTSPITAPVNITLNNSSSGQLMNNFPQFVINGSNPPVFNPGLSPIIINGTFIDNQSIDIWSADIQLGPNAQIIVNPGISFYLSKECYLHSCNGLYMWQGIKLLNDAVLNVTTCLIEDAKQAIYSDLHCFIYINKNSMLNRNYENIVLSNSAFTALDFIFRESIISCNASTWLPGVGGQINFNANATLITPHSNQRTLSGININNILDITIGWQFVGANPSSRFNDAASAMCILRHAKAKAALLIAFADLGGVFDTVAVTEALSDFADASVQAALRFGLNEAMRAGALSPPDPANPEQDLGLFVLALGKHGARELNDSSDIDLTVFYDPDRPGLASADDPQKVAIGLVKTIVKLLNERNADGYVQRVDVRLRPDPGLTPIAMPVNAALGYYETVGQNWERAANIKARPVAGDVVAGRAFIKDMETFIWRKYFDYGAIADIHAMKRQIYAVRVELVTLLQNLGRLLSAYHFPAEWRQIQRLVQLEPATADGAAQQSGMTEQVASCAVLGVELEGIAVAVLRHWGLGDAVLHLVRRMPLAPPPRTIDNDDDMLRAVASCAHEAVDALGLRAQAQDGALKRVTQRYGRALGVRLEDLKSALHEAVPGKSDAALPIGQAADAR